MSVVARKQAKVLTLVSQQLTYDEALREDLATDPSSCIHDDVQVTSTCTAVSNWFPSLWLKQRDLGREETGELLKMR